MDVSEKPQPKSKNKSCQSQLLQPKPNLGRIGEQTAARFLQSQGYKLIAQNVRLGKGELDLVMWDPHLNELVFVEVKTRSSSYSGDPSLAVDHRKLRALLQTAHQFLKESWRKYTPFRLDVIAISPGKILHIPAITWQLL